MALCKFGGGITGITGKISGVYFSRDKTGYHICAQKRLIKQRTPAQNNQRNAFRAAQNFSRSMIGMSYNIYRALNNLPTTNVPTNYSIMHLKGLSS